ncbi:sugar transferase [Aestuariivita boseongensis]|uniref:sugar transferase n=1 Tax=Aestuariivita boseongensis TaxID=1470562 RepID=UPI0006813E3F
MDAKRAMDIGFSTLLLLLLAPVIGGLVIWLLLRQGRPIFFLSERMSAPDRPFVLVKFRTMEVVENDQGVCGGDKRARITPQGRWLRRSRLDELPQLWNILKGDLSFVGPRPPLPSYVHAFPEIYADILQVKPGVTGLATLAFRQREERMLKRCRSPEETHLAYVTQCIPKKARLDRHYIRTRTLAGDMLLVFQTIGDLVRRR